MSAEAPFPMGTGFRILPDDLQEAICFITHRGAAGIKGFRLKQLASLQQQASELMLRLHEFRSAGDPSRSNTRARIHVSLLEEPSKENGMGGPEWSDQSVKGSPMIGELGEPGVCPPPNDPAA